VVADIVVVMVLGIGMVDMVLVPIIQVLTNLTLQIQEKAMVK